MTDVFNSSICALIHEDVEDAYHKSSMDKKNMRNFDALCLATPKNMNAGAIASSAFASTSLSLFLLQR